MLIIRYLNKMLLQLGGHRSASIIMRWRGVEKSLLRQQHLLSVFNNLDRGRHRETTKYLLEPCLTCRKQRLSSVCISCSSSALLPSSLWTSSSSRLFCSSFLCFSVWSSLSWMACRSFVFFLFRLIWKPKNVCKFKTFQKIVQCYYIKAFTFSFRIL